ncbi:Bacteriophage FIG01208078: hypothetical protein [Olavius algarvensis spirochete endosymbiont]|uniref:DUF2924 domain-containing protein n=1 Tax=Olavius algarvensis spirochete endosymbiont TaxID=260710 RepID=UPI000F161CCB|nr:DUF2924 domain-containing protein [Olavius algarvensis spirochete endosymbiont]VDA98995.1 Bacteriophage FIG01208078: hypothetical protein [Olavius algarvensis spirochete endosymbiont]
MNELQETARNGKNSERSRNSVLRQLATLQTLTLEQLREKWPDLYGSDPPRYKKQFLIKRLAYRIQELFYGGLSGTAKARLRQIAQDDPVATVEGKVSEERKSNENILPGTRFVRVWNDRRYEVTAREKGFEYDGRIFRSLSAVAREITGTRWNGKVFFGLKKSYGKKEQRWQECLITSIQHPLGRSRCAAPSTPAKVMRKALSRNSTHWTPSGKLQNHISKANECRVG